jgi:hypothetical protein
MERFGASASALGTLGGFALCVYIMNRSPEAGIWIIVGASVLTLVVCFWAGTVIGRNADQLPRILRDGVRAFRDFLDEE